MSKRTESSSNPIHAKKIALIFAACAYPVSLFAQASNLTPPPQKAQPALVTFVDNGMSLGGGLPGQKSQSFRGKLFIENVLLAEMQPAHFITFDLQPVTVEFTAQTWMATGPHGGAHITLNLVAGKHYFIEVRTKEAWPVTKAFGIKKSHASKPKRNMNTTSRSMPPT